MMVNAFLLVRVAGKEPRNRVSGRGVPERAFAAVRLNGDQGRGGARAWSGGGGEQRAALRVPSLAFGKGEGAYPAVLGRSMVFMTVGITQKVVVSDASDPPILLRVSLVEGGGTLRGGYNRGSWEIILRQYLHHAVLHHRLDAQASLHVTGNGMPAIFRPFWIITSSAIP
jgi:hypothetical protein